MAQMFRSLRRTGIICRGQRHVPRDRLADEAQVQFSGAGRLELLKLGVGCDQLVIDPFSGTISRIVLEMIYGAVLLCILDTLRNIFNGVAAQYLW